MLTHLKNKITALENFSFENELKSIVDNNKDRLADLQREQLAEGVDSNAKPIKLKDNAPYGYEYRPFTISEKKKHGKGIGAITSHVTWFMVGDLHNSIRAFIQGDKFKLKSNDFKFSKLIERSGEEAVGLNKESTSLFSKEIVLPQMKEAYRSKV